jgi:hypothetical protein
VELQFRFVGERSCLINRKWSSGLLGRARCFGVEMAFLPARGFGIDGIFWGILGEKSVLRGKLEVGALGFGVEV